jgi:membrane protein implicated in regulation of membrane protease activity
LKYFALYTLARIGLFVGVFLLIWLLIFTWVAWSTVSLLWTVLVAAVLSSIASIFVLRRPRERFAVVIEQRASRMTTRIGTRVEESRRKEDPADDTGEAPG